MFFSVCHSCLLRFSTMSTSHQNSRLRLELLNWELGNIAGKRRPVHFEDETFHSKSSNISGITFPSYHTIGKAWSAFKNMLPHYEIHTILEHMILISRLRHPLRALCPLNQDLRELTKDKWFRKSIYSCFLQFHCSKCANNWICTIRFDSREISEF